MKKDVAASRQITRPQFIEDSFPLERSIILGNGAPIGSDNLIRGPKNRRRRSIRNNNLAYGGKVYHNAPVASRRLGLATTLGAVAAPATGAAITIGTAALGPTTGLLIGPPTTNLVGAGVGALAGAGALAGVGLGAATGVGALAGAGAGALAGGAIGIPLATAGALLGPIGIPLAGAGLAGTSALAGLGALAGAKAVGIPAKAVIAGGALLVKKAAIKTKILTKKIVRGKTYKIKALYLHFL